MSLLQKIVKNDSMKLDPPEIYGWRVYALAGAACFGGLIFGIDTGIIGGILRMQEFRQTYRLTEELASDATRASVTANIVSILQAGCFIGALLGATLADRFGRKPALIWGAGGISLIGVALQAAASGHLPAMYVGRFVSGFSTGIASMVNPLYVAENAPRAIRGGLTGVYQLFIVFGIFLAYWINYGSILHLPGNARYLVPLCIQALPPVLLMVSMWFCHESPRHLAKQDKWEEALAVLSTVRALPAEHPYIVDEFHGIRVAIEEENALLDGASWLSLQKEMWLVPTNRKRALVSIAIGFCQQITGTNAVNYYAPQIFATLGVSGANNELFATGIYGLVKLISVFIFIVFVADSLGRRWSLIWTGIGQALTMLYIGIFILVVRPTVGGEVTASGYVALVSVFLFAVIYQFGWGPVTWIYISEIATARLRATNVSYAVAMTWLVNFAVSFSVPHMLRSMGPGGFGTYIFFASFCFAMAVFVYFFVPETKGLSLEDMNELFGAPAPSGGQKKDIETASVDHTVGNGKRGSVTQLEDLPGVSAKAN